MEVTAKLKYLRIAPRKVRLLTDLVRGKKIKEAEALLDFSLKRGAKSLRKLLDSAVTSAIYNFQLDEKTLYISKITVDEGPKLKRWRARARGRAAQIQKKVSHITLVLKGEKGEKVEEKKPEIKKEEKRLKPKPKPETPKPEREIIPAKKQKKGLRKIFRRKAF